MGSNQSRRARVPLLLCVLRVMQILLQVLGKTTTLECCSEDTVASLHAKVAESQGISQFYLTYATKTLSTLKATLGSYGVESGSSVRALLQLRGGGNGMRTCERAHVNASLVLRRTDSTMLSQNAHGEVILVVAPRIAYKRQRSFSRAQVMYNSCTIQKRFKAVQANFTH